jgi:hypothetical protein
MNPLNRHAIALIMTGLGALLILLAPEAWPGAMLLIMGVDLELLGIALEHKVRYTLGRSCWTTP